MNSPLHLEIAREVIVACREENFQIGTQIGEQTFAKRLGVSRAPVHRALLILEKGGILKHTKGKGFVLRTLDFGEAQLDATDRQEKESDLLSAIMADRARGDLAPDVSESELIARYGMPRGAVRKALQRLATENLVMRQRGHGWRFVDSLDNEAALSESYAFRIEIECGALRQVSYHADPAQLNHLKQQHLRLSENPNGATREEWLRLNASYHDSLVAWSGNRFLHQAIIQQNNLRRVHLYADFSVLPVSEINNNCNEHLAILAAIEKEDLQLAQTLLKQHLEAGNRKSFEYLRKKR